MGNAGAREEFAHTVTTVLLIYTFKSGKSDRGKKKYTKIIKYPLSFEIWIFRCSQPDRDEDRRISMTIDQYILANYT